MNRLQAWFVVFGIGALSGAAIVYWLYPRYVKSIETRTETVTKNNVHTVIKTVARPDGTVETTKDILDRSVNVEKTVISLKLAQARYLLGISAGTQLRALQPIYGAQASVRVLGPIFLGAYGRADGEFGALLTMEF